MRGRPRESFLSLSLFLSQRPYDYTHKHTDDWSSEYSPEPRGISKSSLVGAEPRGSTGLAVDGGAASAVRVLSLVKLDLNRRHDYRGIDAWEAGCT